MPKFVIERDVPGIGHLHPRDQKAAAMKSNRTLNELGPEIQWQHSYISGDKTYCVFIAPHEELIHEHGKRSEFPVTNISEVETIWDPTTGEMQVSEDGLGAA